MLSLIHSSSRSSRHGLNRNRAFSRIELIAVASIGLLLVLLLCAMLPKAKVRGERIQCVNNLKNLGLAFRIFASAKGGGLYPMSLLTNSSSASSSRTSLESYDYFGALSNRISSPLLLVCPADKRQPATSIASLRSTNISYFIGMETSEMNPTSLLAGDRNLTIDGVPAKRGLVEIKTGQVVKWTDELHKGQGNVALGDGSVQWLTQPRLEQFIRTSTVTNRLLIP